MPCDRNREPCPESTDNLEICWTPVKTWVGLSYFFAIVCGVTCCTLLRFYVKDPVENSIALPWAVGFFGAFVVWMIPGFVSGPRRSSVLRDFSRRNTVLRAGTRSVARNATNLLRNSGTSFRNWMWREGPNRWARTRPVEIRRSHDVPRLPSDVVIRLPHDQPTLAEPYNISGHLDSDPWNVVAAPRPVIVLGFDDPGTPRRTRRDNWRSHPNCPHSD